MDMSLPGAPETRPFRVLTGCVKADSGAADAIIEKDKNRRFIVTSSILSPVGIYGNQSTAIDF
jgi:hypothetical protein